MNSLQQTSESPGSISPEDFVKEFEAKLEREQDAETVEKLHVKLQFLGLNFDPFAGEASGECRQVMQSLGLTQHLSNPYLATNLLLRLLDKTEERINQLKQ
jgi:hypothetical protein